MKRVLGILMAVLLVVGFAVIVANADGGVVAADDTVTIASTDITSSFTDPAFLAKVYEITGITPGDPIMDTDVNKIQDLDLRRLGITSLDGLEEFTALRIFDCSFNELNALDLSKNKELVHVKCTDNQISDANMSGLDNLQTLDLSYNLMETFDASNLPALMKLHLTCNYLTSLDITNTPNLKQLNVVYNEFTAKTDITGYTADLDKLELPDYFAYEQQGKPVDPPDPGPGPGPGPGPNPGPNKLEKLDKLEKTDPAKEWLQTIFTDAGANVKVDGFFWWLWIFLIPFARLF